MCPNGRNAAAPPLTGVTGAAIGASERSLFFEQERRERFSHQTLQAIRWFAKVSKILRHRQFQSGLAPISKPLA